MEKTSDLELKWYLNYWIHTTKRIDYSIKTIIENEGSTFVTIERLGDFPMPVDLFVTLKNGSKELYYIPLNEMMGSKPVEDETIQRFDQEEWPWVNPSYTVKLNHKPSEIISIEIDASQRMADVDRKNNVVDISRGIRAYKAEKK
jgi:hypothetical protein